MTPWNSVSIGIGNLESEVHTRIAIIARWTS